MDGHFFEFYALGSDCSLQLITPSRSLAEDAALAVEREVARIEARYSRYRPNSELSRINNIAAIGGSVDVDPETAGLIEYANACFRKSDGLFGITSGLLRQVWNFHLGTLPTEKMIAELLPRIGLSEWAASVSVVSLMTCSNPKMRSDESSFCPEQFIFSNVKFDK